MITKRSIWVTIGNDCNLRCKYCCYEMKSIETVGCSDYLSFIQRMTDHIVFNLKEVPTLNICGWGESFHYEWFVGLLNSLDKDRYEYINITTNGTHPEEIDKIDDIEKLSFTLSLDAPEKFHDKNRGSGNFRKTIKFIKKLQERGVQNIYIYNILGKSNIGDVPEVISFYNNELGISYICFNTLLSNTKTNNFRKDYDPSGEILIEEDFTDLFVKYPEYFTREYSFPDTTNIDEHPLYLSLKPDGTVTNCCEGNCHIGNFQDSAEVLFEKLEKSSHCGICEKRSN